MKASFICPARNKGRHVGKCIESMLAQTEPCEILISVQQSDDDTLAVARDAVTGYRGASEVRVIECPAGDYRGMRGLNEHLNWIHTQITGDVVINCSADDYNEPQRVERTMRVFETFKPSYIGTRVLYETPEGQVVGETGFPDRYSRFVSVAEAIKGLIGSSASSAWSRALWDKYAPLRGVEAQDMILPMMALFERGVYYIDEPLHHHVLHADPNNTGVEGQMRAAAEDPAVAARFAELNGFSNTHHWTNIYQRLADAGHFARLSKEGYEALIERIVSAAHNWSRTREDLAMRRIEPMGLSI